MDFNELQSEIGQLKYFMIAMMEVSNGSSTNPHQVKVLQGSPYARLTSTD